MGLIFSNRSPCPLCGEGTVHRIKTIEGSSMLYFRQEIKMVGS